MTSAALTGLVSALDEVRDLESVYPPIRGSLRTARAVGRAGVVLLSGHFERYFFAVNEEAATFLNASAVPRAAIPQELRLVHSWAPVDALGRIQWDNRGGKLEEFVGTDGWLWRDGHQGRVDHDRLLEWMGSPAPKNLLRYYRQWGIADIFTTITRRPQSRSRLWLAVSELVDKRNNIAHGDVAAEASRGDVRRYKDTVFTFCSRADRALSKQLERLVNAPGPW